MRSARRCCPGGGGRLRLTTDDQRRVQRELGYVDPDDEFVHDGKGMD
ncbi:hypothetical protein [Salmonirosea aquatica]